jgi:hypothetical protein
VTRIGGRDGWLPREKDRGRPTVGVSVDASWETRNPGGFVGQSVLSE